MMVFPFSSLKYAKHREITFSTVPLHYIQCTFYTSINDTQSSAYVSVIWLKCMQISEHKRKINNYDKRKLKENMCVCVYVLCVWVNEGSFSVVAAAHVI